MRLIPVLAAAVLMTAAPALAQTKTEDEKTFVVFGDKRAPTAMAAWEEGGAVKSAAGDAAGKQAKAVKYQGQVVPWPTGTVKVLTFSKASGGVLHPITDETEVYVLKGTLQAEVDGKPVTLKAGDVATWPKGALRNAGGTAADATVVTWSVAPLQAGATPTVVTGDSVKETMPPGDKPTLAIRRYEFPGNSIRAVKLFAGAGTSPNTAKTDSLIYLTEGALVFHQDGQKFDVKGGDFIREVAGLMHHWEVKANSAFVTTSALPKGAGPIDPSKATDRPPAK
jgi:quercetin dioxygenase-like cupin family protein